MKRALSYGAYSAFQAFRDEGVLVAQAQTRNDAVPEVAQVMLAERGIPSHDLQHNLEILAEVVCGILSAEHAAGAADINR